MSMPKVSQEFLKENKRSVKHKPKSSPHTKTERKKRREEVFKLHFEYGYSARQIANMMNVNRNTINNDVSFWYSRTKSDSDKKTSDDWLIKQFSRMESQRARLRRELDISDSLQERLQIEKMLSSLDSKISNLVIKLETSRSSVLDKAVLFINEWMKDHGYSDRYLSQSDLRRVPEKTRDKIYELLHK